MAELYYLPQFKQVNLVAPAGITAVQTTGIQLSNVDGIDITKPGLICITWAIALDTSVAEWVTYTSIDANNELVGVTRGAEGYSAKEHLSNAVIAWVFSKSHINNLNDNYLVQHNSDGTHKAATVTTLKTSGAEINAGTEDAKIVTPKSIADSYISNVYNSLYRQALINGNFDVWQRGTSFVPGVAAYCADRFQSYRAAVGSTVSRQTAALNGSTYSLRAQRDSSNSATDPIFITHSLPSSDSMKLRGQKVTFSFWAKCGANYSATSTGLYFIVQSGTGTDQNINGGLTNAATVVTNTVTLTTSWQKFTATSSAVLADTVNQLGLYFRFTPTGTAGANDWFEITQVQLCAGDVALPFMPKIVDQEERDCKLYFERIGIGTSMGSFGGGFWQDATHFYCTVTCQPKRIPILAAHCSDPGYAQFRILGGGGALNCASNHTYSNNTGWSNDRILVVATTGSNTVGAAGLLQRTDASTGCYIDINQEL